MIWKCISFVTKGDVLNGHYFYNAPTNSEYNGHIYGVVELTLEKAIYILKTKGIDVIKDYNITIGLMPNNL